MKKFKVIVSFSILEKGLDGQFISHGSSDEDIVEAENVTQAFQIGKNKILNNYKNSNNTIEYHGGTAYEAKLEG